MRKFGLLFGQAVSQRSAFAASLPLSIKNDHARYSANDYCQALGSRLRHEFPSKVGHGWLGTGASLIAYIAPFNDTLDDSNIR